MSTISNTIDVYINKNPIFLEFNDRFYILRFADKLPELKIPTKKTTEETDSLFNDEEDNEIQDEFSTKFLFEYTTKILNKEDLDKIVKETVDSNYTEFEEIDKINIGKINLPITEFRLTNLVLFQNTSLAMLLNIVNFVCRCKIDQLLIKNSSTEYYEYLSVGDKPLYFKRAFDFVNDFSSNITLFSNWYIKNFRHINSIMNKIDTFEHFITNFSLVFFPKTPLTTDIIKIFNKTTTLSNWWSRKVILHDSYIDLSKGTSKIQYIKQSRNANEFNKHILAKANTITFIFKIKLRDTEINFSSIDISKEGLFTMNFTMNTLMEIKDVMSNLHNFITAHAKEYFGESSGEDKIIDYLMYRTMFKNFTYNAEARSIGPNDFTIGTGHISTIYSFAYNKKNRPDVNSVRTLYQFGEIKSRFSSKTSTCLNFYAFANAINLSKFKHYSSKLTPSVVYNMLLPELKFDDADSAINIFASKFSTIKELEFALNFSFPIYSLESHLKDVPEDHVEAILARLRNISIKQNLKILMNNDPILFGPRQVPGGDIKAYSALVQQKNQRPSIISKSDYEEIYTKYPESVVNIKNLSNIKQRIYLACPYSSSRYVNFHTFEDQPCIVRCTTRKSNIAQLRECAKSLGVEDARFLTRDANMLTSHSTIKYTPNLAKGRKCYLPGRLGTLFPLLYCLRASDVTNNIASLNDYFNYNFKGISLIIKPNLIEEEFEILTELDVTGETLYYLVIQPSNNEHNKYVVVDEQGIPFCVNDNTELFNFIKEHYKSNSIHRQIIEYIHTYIWPHAKKDIRDYLSLNEYIRELTNNDFRVVVHPKSNQLKGLLFKNHVFYTVPIIYWYYANASNSIHTNFVLDKILSKQIIFEDIDTLIKRDKDCSLVIDIKSNVVGVKITEDLLIPCNPVPLNDYYNSKVPFKSDSIVDMEGYLIAMLVTKNPSEIIFDLDLSNTYKYLELVKSYLQKFFKIYPEFEKLDKPIETFIKLVEDISGGFIEGDIDEFITIPYSADVLDLYKTKLSKKNFLEFVYNNPYIDFNSKTSMLDAICESLIKNTELEYLPIETIFEKDFI